MEAALKELEEGTNLSFRKLAAKHGVVRSTLSRRWKNETVSMAEKAENQQLLSHQHERTLVDYINKLTLYGIPPTPSMLRNLVFDMCGTLLSRSWTAEFVTRQPKLDSRYLNPLNKSRKKADSYMSYEEYFRLVKEKLEKHRILPHNTYNIDEKGFIVGVV